MGIIVKSPSTRVLAQEASKQTDLPFRGKESPPDQYAEIETRKKEERPRIRNQRMIWMLKWKSIKKWSIKNNNKIRRFSILLSS